MLLSRRLRQPSSQPPNQPPQIVAMNCPNCLRWLMTVAITAFALPCGVNAQSARDDRPSILELTNDARERAKLDQRSKLREVMSRQQGDVLKLFLKGQRLFVQGKKLTDAELTLILRESKWSRAIVTVNAGVPDRCVSRVNALIRKNGLKKIEIRPTTTDADRSSYDLQPAARSEKAHNAVKVSDADNRSHEKLRVIAIRQKGDILRVFLRDSGRIYVNGKSVSQTELTTLCREMGLARAEVESGPQASQKYAEDVIESLRKSGMDNVDQRVHEVKR